MTASPETAPASTPVEAKGPHPKFNHVAMSVPADLLDDKGRKEILDFYSEVFGWQEMPTETEDRVRLVLMAYEFGQFVFLIADKNPMQAPRMDHFGMSVDSMAELDEFLARCQAYKEKDDRVDIVPKHTDDYGVLKLTGFYVRYLLPMMIEVQHFEWVAGGEYHTPNVAPAS
jgi:hypothetical protein